jgi:hypothetical protein
LIEIFKSRNLICARGAGQPVIFGHLENTEHSIVITELFYVVPIRITEARYNVDLRRVA